MAEQPRQEQYFRPDLDKIGENSLSFLCASSFANQQSVDATLKGILAILAKADPETRCAALVILTQLKADDDRVVAEAAKALAAKNTVVRDFALGYFEAVQPAAGLPAVLGLFDSEDAAVRQRAVAIAAASGSAAVAAARKLLKDAPRRRWNATVELCARVRSAAALDLLFDAMAGDDFDTNRGACDALLSHLGDADSRTRTEILERADKLAAAAKAPRHALIAAAKLMGAIGDVKARKRLIPLATHSDHGVQTHALGAAVQCLRGQKLTPAEIESLFSALGSDDEMGVLRPVVRLLDEQTLDRAYLTKLNKLAESPQPLVKRFAVQKLGEFEGGNVVKTLIGYLTDDSYARRDQAATSLKQLPAARLPLMKEFLECDDERKAWTIGGILLVHDRSWKRDAIAAVVKKLEKSLEGRDDRLHTAYFHFLNTLDAVQAAEAVKARALHLRKTGKFGACAKWLHLLRDSPAFDADARYLLALCEIKSHNHSLTPTARRHDPALEIFRGLASAAFPVAERLCKDRAPTPDELFYVAFNFAEGSIAEREVAAEILEHIAAKFGRTKTGKAAKNKLALLRR